MKVYLTKVQVITSKKDGAKYLKVEGVKEDGAVFTGMCKDEGVTPELDITPSELAQYTIHEVQFDVGFDGKARMSSVVVAP